MQKSRSKSKIATSTRSRNSSQGGVVTTTGMKGNKLNLVIELSKADQENIGFTIKKSPRKKQRAKSPKKRNKSKSWVD